MIRVTSKAPGLDRLKIRIGSLPILAQQGGEEGLKNLAEATAADVRQTLGTEKDFLPAVVTVETDTSGVQVSVDLPFARYLEFGTTKMAARPFLRPAAARAGQNAAATLTPHLDAALKKMTP